MKKALNVLLVFLLAFAVFAGGQQEADQGQAAEEAAEDSKYGGVLVFGRGGDSVGLDPARETDGESFYASTQIFDNLVEFKNGTTEVQPALAKSWDISDDGLTFTFHLVEIGRAHV